MPEQRSHDHPRPLQGASRISWEERKVYLNKFFADVRPAFERMRKALPDATFEAIAGGMVPLPDQMPEEFAAAVERFLDQL